MARRSMRALHWKESLHPRDDRGRFAHKGGGKWMARVAKELQAQFGDISMGAHPDHPVQGRLKTGKGHVIDTAAISRAAPRMHGPAEPPGGRTGRTPAGVVVGNTGLDTPRVGRQAGGVTTTSKPGTAERPVAQAAADAKAVATDLQIKRDGGYVPLSELRQAMAGRGYSRQQQDAAFEHLVENDSNVGFYPFAHGPSRLKEEPHKFVSGGEGMNLVRVMNNDRVPIGSPTDREDRATGEAGITDPADLARIRAALAEHGGGYHGGPMGLSKSDAARYTTEGHLKGLTAKYGHATVQDAVAAEIARNPHVLDLKPGSPEHKAMLADRLAASQVASKQALAAVKAGNYDEAQRIISDAELADPNYREGGFSWGDMRKYVGEQAPKLTEPSRTNTGPKADNAHGGNTGTVAEVFGPSGPSDALARETAPRTGRTAAGVQAVNREQARSTEGVVRNLRESVQTREAAQAELDGLTVAELRDVARQLNVRRDNATKQDLKDRIVERTVGSRLNSRVLRESVPTADVAPRVGRTASGEKVAAPSPPKPTRTNAGKAASNAHGGNVAGPGREFSMRELKSILAGEQGYAPAVRSTDEHRRLLEAAGATPAQSEAILKKLGANTEQGHLTADLTTALHFGARMEAEREAAATRAAKLLEATPKAYAGLLGDGNGAVTHPRSRQVIEAMQANGWVIKDVRAGGISTWGPPGDDSKSMTMIGGKDRPVFMIGRGQKLSGAKAIEHVGGPAPATRPARLTDAQAQEGFRAIERQANGPTTPPVRAAVGSEGSGFVEPPAAPAAPKPSVLDRRVATLEKRVETLQGRVGMAYDRRTSKGSRIQSTSETKARRALEDARQELRAAQDERDTVRKRASGALVGATLAEVDAAIRDTPGSHRDNEAAWKAGIAAKLGLPSDNGEPHFKRDQIDVTGAQLKIGDFISEGRGNGLGFQVAGIEHNDDGSISVYGPGMMNRSHRRVTPDESISAWRPGVSDANLPPLQPEEADLSLMQRRMLDAYGDPGTPERAIALERIREGNRRQAAEVGGRQTGVVAAAGTGQEVRAPERLTGSHEGTSADVLERSLTKLRATLETTRNDRGPNRAGRVSSLEGQIASIERQLAERRGAPGKGDAGASPAAAPSSSRLTGDITGSRNLHKSATSTVDLVTLADGTKAIRKTSRGADGKRAADATDLSSKVGQALGVATPDVVKTGRNTVMMSYVSSPSAYDAGLDRTAIAELAASPEGRRTALFELLTNHDDMSSRENWAVHNGQVTPLDLDSAWQEQRDPAKPPAESWARSPFSKPFIDGKKWKSEADGGFTQAEIADARTRLESLRPQFEAAGRGDWFDFMQQRLDALEKASTPVDTPRVTRDTGDMTPEPVRNGLLERDYSGNPLPSSGAAQIANVLNSNQQPTNLPTTPAAGPIPKVTGYAKGRELEPGMLVNAADLLPMHESQGNTTGENPNPRGHADWVRVGMVGNTNDPAYKSYNSNRSLTGGMYVVFDQAGHPVGRMSANTIAEVNTEQNRPEAKLDMLRTPVKVQVQVNDGFGKSHMEERDSFAQVLVPSAFAQREAGMPAPKLLSPGVLDPNDPNYGPRGRRPQPANRPHGERVQGNRTREQYRADRAKRDRAYAASEPERAARRAELERQRKADAAAQREQDRIAAEAKAAEAREQYRRDRITRKHEQILRHLAEPNPEVYDRTTGKIRPATAEEAAAQDLDNSGDPTDLARAYGIKTRGVDRHDLAVQIVAAVKAGKTPDLEVGAPKVLDAVAQAEADAKKIAMMDKRRRTAITKAIEELKTELRTGDQFPMALEYASDALLRQIAEAFGLADSGLTGRALQNAIKQLVREGRTPDLDAYPVTSLKKKR